MTSFSLQDEAIRAMLNKHPQEVQPWVEANFGEDADHWTGIDGYPL